MFIKQQIKKKNVSGWTWLLGSSVGNQHTRLSTSQSSDLFYPGSRADFATWPDDKGQLWGLGGYGYDDNPTNEPKVLSDLWKFNLKLAQWHLIDGANDHKGKSHKYRPKPRSGATLCGVTDTMLVLFGGKDKNGQALYDTWIFDIAHHTWLPVYVKDAHKKKNRVHPPPRYDCAHWCTKDHMILFGGRDGQGRDLDDMWIFSHLELKWKKQKQYVQMNHLLSKEHSLPFPAARSSATTWMINNQTFYMFGGITSTNTTVNGEWLDDLWQFTFNDSTWTSVHSVNLAIPVARKQAAAWLSDNQKKLLLFGGCTESNGTVSVLDDLWMFDLEQKLWAKTKDNALYTLNSKHLQADIINQARWPSARCRASFWDHNGQHYLLAGWGKDHRDKISYLNDFFILFENRKAVTELLKFTASVKFTVRLSGSQIFLICLSIFGGVVLVFGAAFFFKKMVDYPRHHPTRSYNVKYSPLKDEASFDM